MKLNALVILVFGFLLSSCKSETLGSVLDVIDQGMKTNLKPTASEASRGLKEALSVSIEAAALSLTKENAYFSNEAIKILLPDEAKTVIKTLDKMGLNSLTEKLILKLNRAAEDAAKNSVPIFKEAILSLSFKDSMSLLTSKNQSAATDFLKDKTFFQLKSLYKTSIQSSLRKVGADEIWARVFKTYNQIPGLKKVNPSLSDHATERALIGLFHTVSKREASLRSDLSLRTSPLLRRVFAYADSLK
jgi:hypothetical protein